jgi:hypothetical protein
VNEDRERSENEERGWDELLAEDEERLVPREQFEKQYPPIIDSGWWKRWWKTALVIFAAFLPIAMVVAFLLVLGHYL